MKKWISLFLIFFSCSLYCLEKNESRPACWDGHNFHVCEAHQLSNTNYVPGDTVYFAASNNACACYGHALLDCVVPLYELLKQNELIHKPINLIVKVDSYLEGNATFLNIVKLINDIFKINEFIFVKDDLVARKKSTQTPSQYVLKTSEERPLFFEKLLIHETVPFVGAAPKYFSFYANCPESFEYMYILRAMGIREGIVYQDQHTNNNLVKEFVRFVKSAYQINDAMIKNRVLVTHRPNNKRIVNEDDVVAALKKHGYDVVVVDFEQLSIKDQLLATVQSEYLIGTYGSQLVNAVFLHPQAKVVVLWHKYAKYFWSRRYCIIHSAFLAAGVKLIEYDQEDYDGRNNYPDLISAPDYFIKYKKINVLRPEKENMEAMINYPLPAMYELTNIDLYIEPKQLIKLIKGNV